MSENVASPAGDLAPTEPRVFYDWAVEGDFPGPPVQSRAERTNVYADASWWNDPSRWTRGARSA